MQVTVGTFRGKFSGNTKFPSVLLLAFIVFITTTGRVTSFAPTLPVNNNELVGKAFGKQSGAALFNVDFLQGNKLNKLNSCKGDGDKCNNLPLSLSAVLSDPKCCGDCKPTGDAPGDGICADCIKDGVKCESNGCCPHLYCKDNGDSDPKNCQKCILKDKPCNPDNDGCCEQHFCHQSAKLCKKCIENDGTCVPPYDVCCNGAHCQPGTQCAVSNIVSPF